MKRYSDLIKKSDQLEIVGDCQGSVFFFEPFYQLMRQTLWAEQMVNNKNEEDIYADDFIHIHVVPNGNTSLREKKYMPNRDKNMYDTWSDKLEDRSKYVLISPDELFSKLPYDEWKDLICYLKARYWQ